ncbi:MAG TPA: hypothetical protein VGW98_11630 [Solirubrobacteraceae bacterium]|nr:hypothetical protein [Solirubrobacteraceae bacterium]
MRFAGLPRSGRDLGVVPGLAVMVSVLAIAASASATTSVQSSSARIDPFGQPATLTPSDEIGMSVLGSAVALSSDGKIALIGGPGDSERRGAVWVFKRSGSTWAEQAKLTGGGEIGGGRFGSSVALS